MTSQITTIPTPQEAIASVRWEAAEVYSATQMFADVTTDEELAQAQRLVAEIKATIKRADKHRLALVAEPKRALSAIDAAFKDEIKGPLNAERQRIERLAGPYLAEQERQRREAARAAAEAARREAEARAAAERAEREALEAAEREARDEWSAGEAAATARAEHDQRAAEAAAELAAQATAVATRVDAPEGLSVRLVYDYRIEVVDVHRVPAEYLRVDEAAIKRAAKQTPDLRVPGVVIHKEQRMGSTLRGRG